MSNVRIVTDSACDLPAEVADKMGIEIVPLSIRFGEDEFIDREQLNVAEFWNRCVNMATLPETAAPAPGQFESVYRRLAAEGTTGIVAESWPDSETTTIPVVPSLSGQLSATIQSAELAARSLTDDDNLKLDIRIVDSRSVSMGIGTIAIACARAAADGQPLDAVEALAYELSDQTRVFAALDTLDNLKKGGRIGGAKAFLATALSIKPIIDVTGGVVAEAGKQRTRSKALKHLVERFRSYHGRVENLAVLHADCSDVDVFVEMLRPYYDGDILIGEIGPVIGTHGGRGTIGVAFHETT